MRLNPKYLVPTELRSNIRMHLRHLTYDYTYPRIYRTAAREPVDSQKAVFVENDSSELSDNMRFVRDELQQRGFVCEFVSLHMNRGSYADHVHQCKLMAQMVATARLVFICDTCAPVSCLPIRSETTVVQLWHACGAFKRFGMSTADKIFGSDREEKERYPEHRNTSLVTVSSPEIRWAYIEAMCMEKTSEVVQALGVSRTDVYFDGEFVASQHAKVVEVVPQADGKKVLLYAPTFRGRVFGAQAPTELEIEQLCDALQDEFVMLVKQHPFVKNRPPIPAGCEDFAFDVSDSLPIETCLCAADVCITDYSSLIFEYALLRRPMLFFAPDRDDYDDWRGFYYDYDQMTPGPVCTTTEEVVDYLAHMDERFDPAEIDAFKEKFMASCDGHATERIVAAALGEEMLTRGQTFSEKIPLGGQSPRRDFDMSVVVPMYNVEKFLRRSVESLDAQTASQDVFEVLLVNDGSTDGTLALAEELASERPNYRVFTQKNKGVSAARNAGIRAARGRYIMFLDADDELSAPSIEALVAAFDEFGDAVDLVTYPIEYHDMQTGTKHFHSRSAWLKQTGVYDLKEYPFIAQSTVNVCVRNSECDPPLFSMDMKMGEDQFFNTTILQHKAAIGYCADAQYGYTRYAQSARATGDNPQVAYEDMLRLYQGLLDIAHSNARMKDYAYALVLYNVSWRLREHRLLPPTVDEMNLEHDLPELAKILQEVPLKAWEESPYLNEAQRLWFIRRFGVVGDVTSITCSDALTLIAFEEGEQRFSIPEAHLYWAVRKPSCLQIKGFLYGAALLDADGVNLRFSWGSGSQDVRAALVNVEYEDKGVPVRELWHFEVDLPAMEKPYEGRISGVAGDVQIPVFSPSFDLCRANSRRINVYTREFGGRRLVVEHNLLRVGTIKDLPAWSMPVATRLMKLRDKTRTGDFDLQEVRMLREELPRALRALAGERVWLYVHATDALERDMRRFDGVVRLDMDELEGLGARMAALLGAEKVVSGDVSFEDLLPCDFRTWERVADFGRVQTYAYAGEELSELTGTFYDEVAE